MVDSLNPPKIRADRVERASKKRRTPRALFVIPIVFVAVIALLLVVFRGGGGAIPILSGGPDNTVPRFGFQVTKALAVATDPNADQAALKPTAEQIGAEITPAIDELFTNAFLDPSNWRDGDYGEIFGAFAADAAVSAQQDVETLTLGASAGDVYDSVDPEKSTLSYRVLFDPDGNVDTVVAVFSFSATGARTDGTYVALASRGQLFLRDLDGWKITAFKVTRKDHVTEPSPPAPSAQASPSV